MKPLIVVLAILLLLSFSTVSGPVELDLGKGFYYYGDSIRSHIHYLPSYKDTTPPQKARIPKVVWVVIPQVESFGFNHYYILATNKTRSSSSYWLIEKTKEAEEMGFKDSIVLSNAQQVDTGRFSALQKELSIQVRPVSHYRKDFKKE